MRAYLILYLLNRLAKSLTYEAFMSRDQMRGFSITVRIRRNLISHQTIHFDSAGRSENTPQHMDEISDLRSRWGPRDRKGRQTGDERDHLSVQCVERDTATGAY